MGRKSVVRLPAEIRPLDETARHILDAFFASTRAALARCQYEVERREDGAESSVLHVVILVDTSPSIRAYMQTICDGANALIQGLQGQEATTVLVTIRGMHHSDPWINAVPVEELDLPALRRYLTHSGTPLFKGTLSTCALAEAKDEQLREAGVTYVYTQVTVLTDAQDNMSGEVTAELVRTAVKALKATGRFTFRGIGVGPKWRLFRRVFRSMGFDPGEFATVNNAAGVLEQFTASTTAAIEAAGMLALPSGS